MVIDLEHLGVPAVSQGFTVTSVEVLFRGACDECRPRSPGFDSAEPGSECRRQTAKPEPRLVLRSVVGLAVPLSWASCLLVSGDPSDGRQSIDNPIDNQRG